MSLKKNTKKKYFIRQAGFTIFELLVVIFIIGLLTSMVLANYRGGQKRYMLSGDTQKLISNLRKIQNMAMSGTGIYGQYCGYGIEIDSVLRPTSYRIYGDVYNPCASSTNIYNNGVDDIIETISLSPRVSIQSTTFTPLDVFFKPPNPTTYINGDDAAFRSAAIVLELSDIGKTETVTVTTAGLIQ